MKRRMFMRSVAALAAGLVVPFGTGKSELVAVCVEPTKAGAITIPFKTLPMNTYIRGPRFVVMTDCIETARGRMCSH